MSRRLLTRMAWRDAWRHRARSLLMVVMIALPVAGVTAADVLIATSDPGSTERALRQMGTADALLTPETMRVTQNHDGSRQGGYDEAAEGSTFKVATPASVERILGREAEFVPVARTETLVDTEKGRVPAAIVSTDWNNPLTDGLVRTVKGRLPAAPGEVAVNQYLADRGPLLGETFTMEGVDFTVVGVAEDRTSRSFAHVFGGADLVAAAVEVEGKVQDVRPDWLVETPGGISWPEVRKLNDAGVLALSRSVLADPPPDSELDPDVLWDDGGDEFLAVVALIVVMALLEVVLLAGPAFAVSARRMQHSLALMTASGGTPRQARRAVLAMAWVLGSLAAVIGVVVGIGAAKVTTVVGQRWYSEWFGGLDVPWLHVAVIAGFGVLSAVLAAVVPAWIASRQDVVAVLAGRRGDPPAGRRSPVLGLVLVGVGIALAVRGALQQSGGEFQVAVSAVVTVLGVLLLLPMILMWVGRLARRLPLSLRYAVRDATRHRSRTAPAVAAVAATVMAVVALGISLSSDELENQQTYTPSMRMGDGLVNWWGLSTDDVAATREVVRAALPEAALTEFAGPSDDTYIDFRDPDTEEYAQLLDGYGGWGTSVLVAERVPDLSDDLSDEERARADETLGSGGVVAFADRPATLDRVLVAEEGTGEGSEGSEGGEGGVNPQAFPAHVLQVPSGQAGAVGVISPEAARKLGLVAKPVGLHVAGGMSRAAQVDLEERLAGISTQVSVTVERGYQRDGATKLVLLALVAVGALLMLGGTLTSTFLSLADAKPDLRTLAAVGAAPRVRRRVAAGYALVIGGVGAVLGALMGLVPGIAVSFPLTNQAHYGNFRGGPQYFLDIPWLLIAAVVIGLPLFTALVVGLATRSRLPLLARQD